MRGYEFSNERNDCAVGRLDKIMTWDEQWANAKTIEKWLKPEEMVVQLARVLKGPDHQRALDLGCGAGRHVVMLTKEGYDVYASDFSEPAVRYCREWLLREGLVATVTRTDMTKLLYPDDFFELAVAHNVIYHTTFDGMKQLVQTIRRKLRPGGHFYVTLKSTEGWLHGVGVEIEKNTFLRAGKGVPVHFSTEEEIEILFNDFELVQKKHRSYLAETTRKRHASWNLILKKPAAAMERVR